MIRLASLVVLLPLLVAHSFAADRQVAMPDYVQEVWDSKDGRLPHPGVTSILQTRDGYLWIGTFAGLARFDGVRFQLPGAELPALSDHVRCLAETGDGSLWAGTRREGLVRLHDGRITVMTTKDGLASNDARALVATRDGKLWIGSAAGVQVRHPDGRLERVGVAQGLPNELVHTFFVDRDGTLWAGASEYGLAWWDGTRFQAVPLGIAPAATATSTMMNVPIRAVTAIGRDSAGVLYVGTTVGLMRLRGEKTSLPTPTQVLAGPTLAIFGTSRGALWASSSGGLVRVERGEVKTYTAQDGLLHEQIAAIYEDAEGSTWLGTRVGLARLRRRSISTMTVRDGLPSSLVSCVLEARNGDLWVGTRSGVARRRAGVWKTFDTRHGLPNATVRALAEAPDGAIWAGSVEAVARYDDRRERFHAFASAKTLNQIRSLAFDPQGRAWFGAHEGLDRIENGQRTSLLTREQTCEHPGIYHLLSRSDGTMWIGTSGALIEVRDDKPTCHVDREVLARNDIRHLHVDAEGQMWIGSIGGLSRWVGGKRENLKGVAGPFNTAIYGILEDDRGSMWVSTPKGLFEIVKKEIGRYADASAALTLYHSYGVGDGMESSVGTGDGQPNAWRGRDGRLYFTTAAGIAVVDPSQIEHSTQPPPVYVDRMSANREPVDLRGNRTLAAGTREVEIEFTALSFVAPDRVTYKYMLEGFDGSWVDSGTRRTAYYTNLPPGSYRFRVKAASHSGVWNEQGATVAFELLPRFYQRAWFLPLCMALALLCAASLYRWRVATLRARERELRKAVNEAVASVQVLRGMLPVCASCRRVKQDSGSWRQIEAYVMEHTEATFSHTMCADCYGKMREEDPNLPELGKF